MHWDIIKLRNELRDKARRIQAVLRRRPEGDELLTARLDEVVRVGKALNKIIDKWSEV